MPLLASGGLCGRVDPKREGSTLRARKLSLEPAAVGSMAQALVNAARWVGCDTVRVDDVTPRELGVPLRLALAATTDAEQESEPPARAPDSALMGMSR